MNADNDSLLHWIFLLLVVHRVKLLDGEDNTNPPVQPGGAGLADSLDVLRQIELLHDDLLVPGVEVVPLGREGPCLSWSLAGDAGGDLTESWSWSQ